MDNGRWEEPITFETQRLGQYRTIVGAAEAARALMEDWPVETGDALARAKETCLAVLEGREPTAAAREAFLAAAAEAGVFVRP
ncbi:DUF982 domain-containing protein [Shinella sp. BYT-45]|uniref:DUF982 domain-containing protein n=1 Tax=Shinella sp. BYT-45 TaxID=3377377 RepID=UPI00397F789D